MAALNVSPLEIQNAIQGSYARNYAEAAGVAQGGAIDNSQNGRIAGLTNVSFNTNHAKSYLSDAKGGAIYNNGGQITGTMTGSYTGNYAEGAMAQGGAIDNGNGTIASINANFSSNYAKGNTGNAIGGAINNRKNIWI